MIADDLLAGTLDAIVPCTVALMWPRIDLAGVLSPLHDLLCEVGDPRAEHVASIQIRRLSRLEWDVLFASQGIRWYPSAGHVVSGGAKPPYECGTYAKGRACVHIRLRNLLVACCPGLCEGQDTSRYSIRCPTCAAFGWHGWLWLEYDAWKDAQDKAEIAAKALAEKKARERDEAEAMSLDPASFGRSLAGNPRAFRLAARNRRRAT